jgi:hypothetical protein
MVPTTALATVPGIAARIHTIRGQRVMLDSDLAALYGVSTGRLNEQVKRNRDRFPPDFMVALTRREVTNVISQFAISSSRHGGTRKLPYAFTEHGAVMLASVLNSPIAVAASIQVVRAFVQLRGLLVSHKELARRLDDLESRYDAKFRVVFQAIRELMRLPVAPRKEIGFRQA